jgi:hypothetical protein
MAEETTQACSEKAVYEELRESLGSPYGDNDPASQASERLKHAYFGKPRNATGR